MQKVTVRSGMLHTTEAAWNPCLSQLVHTECTELCLDEKDRQVAGTLYLCLLQHQPDMAANLLPNVLRYFWSINKSNKSMVLRACLYLAVIYYPIITL